MNPFMNRRIFLLLICSASICCAQTAPTTPFSVDQDTAVPSWPQSGSGNPGYNDMQVPEQGVYIDPLVPGSNVPPSNGPGADRSSPTIRRPITARSEFELFAE